MSMFAFTNSVALFSLISTLFSILLYTINCALRTLSDFIALTYSLNNSFFLESFLDIPSTNIVLKMFLILPKLYITTNLINKYVIPPSKRDFNLLIYHQFH